MLPSLQSFCIYAAVGILAVYFIQATWFVAWFTLDQRRIEARRDGLVPCYTHRDWTPNECSQRNFFQNFFSRVYAPAVLSAPGKVSCRASRGQLCRTAGRGFALMPVGGVFEERDTAQRG